MWKYKKSEHYSIFYHPNSTAEKDLIKIVEQQEDCYQKLSVELDMILDRPIRLYLCDSPEEIAEITDCVACNGMTFDYDLIYAVYNESVHCLGPHEDAHIFSYQIAIPNSIFLREGFAMYFDEQYHGKRNIEISKEWFQLNSSFSITSLFDNSAFLKLPENISYPLAGTFAVWIIQSYGMAVYRDIYRNEDELYSRLSESPSSIDNLFANKLLKE